MNPDQPWFQHRSEASKAVKKWMKHGSASSKVIKEELFYKYSCVLPTSQRERWQWNHVVDVDVTAVLEGLQCLNWWQAATKLHAIKIPQDGETVFHSISVALWGMPDSIGLVRFLIKSTLKFHSSMWERKFNQDSARDSKIKTWKSDSEHLTPEHIFVLSNILERPIIIVAGQDENLVAEVKHYSASSFCGIYLPLMSKPINCSKMPIFLACHNSRFSPLAMEVPIDDTQGALLNKYPVIFPLVTNNFGMLPVKYLQDNEELRAGELLQDYLIVKEMDVTLGDVASRLLIMNSECCTLPEDKNVIFDYIMKFGQRYNKTKNRRKIFSYPLRVFKGSSRTSNNGSIRLMDAQASGTGVVPNQNRPLYLVRNEPFPMETNTIPMNQEPNETGMSLEPNAPEMCLEPNAPEISLEPNLPEMLEPNAPEMSFGPDVPMSMTNERCVSCKSYRSSVITFPLCHECHEQKNKVDEMQVLKDSPVIDPQPCKDLTMLTLVSDEQEELEFAQSSQKKSENYVLLPAMNAGDLNKVRFNSVSQEEQNSIDTPTAVGALSMRHDDKSVEVSCQPSFDQLSPKFCASPVCESEVSFSEVLCQKCIKILKIHHLTNCDKPCCHNRPENVNPVSYVNRNHDVETTANHFSRSSYAAMQPITEIENNHGLPNYDHHVERDRTKIVSESEPPTSENRLHGSGTLKRTISEPESGRYDNMSDPLNTRSLMVTSLTSVDETNHILNITGMGEESTPPVAFDDENAKSIFPATIGKEKLGADNMEDDNNRDKSGSQRFISAAWRNGSNSKSTLEYLEYNFKKGVNKCKTYSCTNYGNVHKDGYCNKCYDQIGNDRVNHCFSDGFDHCDGVDLFMGEDVVDGVGNDASNHTKQDSMLTSDSDSSDFFTSESESDHAT